MRLEARSSLRPRHSSKEYAKSSQEVGAPAVCKTRPQATGRTSSGWKPSSRIWWQPTPASSARFKWPEAGLHLSGSGETTRRWATRYTAFQQPTPSVQ